MESRWRSFPKIELHRHLEGSLRLSTVLELAQATPAEAESFLVRTPLPDLRAVLNRFLGTQKLLSTPEILTRITREVIEDAFADGIRGLELRYAPTFISMGHPRLDWPTIHSAILAGVKDCEHLPIAVGLICIFQRTVPVSLSEQVMDFVAQTRSTWIGVDLADDEALFPAAQFRNLFRRAQILNLPITIHAGETPHSGQNVIDAIQILGAHRIGHGLQIHRHPEALKLVQDRRIPLELCPTSNWITTSIAKLEDHPFHVLANKGIVTTINSDDPGIFGIDLTNEYEVLSQRLKVPDEILHRSHENALAATFLPHLTLQK